MAKKKSKLKAGSLGKALLIFGLAVAALFVSSQLVARKSVAPNAPESKPEAMEEWRYCGSIGKCGKGIDVNNCPVGYKCQQIPGETYGLCELSSLCPSANCPRLAWRCASYSIPSDDFREQCNGDGTAWDNWEACEFGCQNTICNICKPGNTTCSTAGLKRCNSDGQGYTLTDSCPAGQIYNCSTNRCKAGTTPTPTPTPVRCSPGAKKCVATFIYTCNSAGNGWTNTKDCYPKACKLGICVNPTTPTPTPTPSTPTPTPTPTPICNPGAKKCVATFIYTCNSAGTAWSMTKDCYPKACLIGVCITTP